MTGEMVSNPHRKKPVLMRVANKVNLPVKRKNWVAMMTSMSE